MRDGVRLGAAAGMLVGLSMSAAQSPRQLLTGHIGGDDPVLGCGKSELLKRLYLAGEMPVGGFGERGTLDQTDVLDNNLDIEIIPASETITGSNTMTVRSLADGLTEFTFMLRSNFAITSILENGSVPRASMPTGSYGRVVTLSRPYNTGETFTLRIAYVGQAVSRGFGSIEFTTEGGQPLVHTLSEPYFAATWWPAKDGDFGEPGDNADKATLTLAITAPANMRSVSNGLLQSVQDLPSSKRKYTWRSEYPIATYLVAFSSTVYNTWTGTYDYGEGTMPVEFNIFPAADTPANRDGWARCIDMLGAFRGAYGLYPFIDEKYGIYQFSFGGGMEHQTNTGQGGFSENLTAHELAHQWWGDMVTCRTWSDIWLNEGSATYGEAIWAERRPGSSGLPALRDAMNARRPSDVDDSVYVYQTDNLNRIFSGTFTYLKGAWVLHTLRGALGDGAFFQALANFRSVYEYSAATTDDFAQVISGAAGRDMTAFFDQWVYQPGAPRYAYAWQSTSINGQTYLKLRLRQTHTGSGWPSVYALPVQVRATVTGGTANLVVSNDARDERFVLPLSGAASAVVIDPDDWILNIGETQEAFTPGAPVVLQTSPAPGQTAASGINQVRITFSEPVSPLTSHFELRGPLGVIPFGLLYDAPTQTAVLTVAGALAPGEHNIRVRATLNANGQALDGEVQNGLLPSGDGLPGGDAVVYFQVESCPADFNADGFVTGEDFDAYVAAFEAGEAAADFDGDGFVTGLDFDALVAAFEAGC